MPTLQTSIHHMYDTLTAVFLNGTTYSSVLFIFSLYFITYSQLLSLWIKCYGVDIRMKPHQLLNQQYFHTVPIIKEVILTFESVDETL